MMRGLKFTDLKRLVPGVVLLFLLSIALPELANGQTTIPLKDLSSFKDPGKTWQIAGGATADLNQANTLNASKGTGVLVNLPTEKDKGKDLYTKLEHGDIDLELEYMIAKGSNSGIYLQGQYELQLLDSWGKKTPRSADNGGIYERWDDSKPEGQKGYQGYAPRQNVSRAPGLWQHLKVSFQAPRFDASGKKIENAKILYVELNGVTIHENVELFGPTRGAMSPEDKATGPLRIQGDHGPVAFRNIRITQYDKPRPELTDLTYSIYGGRFEQEPAYGSVPPEAEGSSVILTSDLSPESKQFLIRYQGTLHVKEAGEYTFKLNVPGGGGLMRINKQEVIPQKEWNGEGTVTLPAGKMPFELLYSKFVDWVQPGLGLSVAGPGIREYLISDENAGLQEPVDPILVDAREKPILRSFMDIPDGPRVTHAVSVGSQQQVHYTYDMDHGALVQVWRGGFLDATPMWHDRGNGSSRPVGAIQHLGKPALAVAKLNSEKAAWVSDTTGSAFRPKGYVLGEDNQPTFRYQAYGATVADAIKVLEDGHGLRREITAAQPADGLYFRLAQGSKIEPLAQGMYLIDDKAYYLQIEDAGGAKPVVRDAEGHQELIIPVRQKLVYSILF